MDKMNMQTSNIVDENVGFIESRFPNCIVEARDEDGNLKKMVDFDMLKQELSKVVVDGDKERYQMTWPDKRKAILTANAPINATLRPCREESVDFDNTKNLYIEGDNLDVLKLLRETYLGKVKMIYIDPPYNTGNDFVYNDDFAESTEEYIANSGQFDDQGNRLVQNTESNGRFHTDWLNMIYPRLKIAKDLLSDDGVIFISMDDHENHNLRRICDEIFGARNYVTNFVWEKGKEGGNDSSIMRSHYDNILCYCKDYNAKNIINLDKKDTSRHITEEKEPNLVLGIEECKNTGEPFQLINLSKQKDYTVQIPLLDGTIITWPSYAPQSSIDRWIKEGKVFVGSKHVPYIKSWLKDELQGQKPSNIITQEYGTTKAGSIEMREFFGNREIFSYPKPSVLIKRLTSIGCNCEGIVIDFFSGSSSTAHAVMQLNAEDGGNRRFIMVQLPEKCDEKSEAYKAGYKNICEIGKERIRRAGKKIKEEGGLTTQDLDIGFRVFKLDSSNMKDTYYSPSEYDMSLLDTLDENIKPDRTPEDLLFQVMLDLGLMLDSKIESKVVNGKKVFIVGDYNEAVHPDLVCCFDSDVSNNTVTEIAKMKPKYAVFRDSSMSSDSVAVNFDQLFETYSPSTIRKVL